MNNKNVLKTEEKVLSFIESERMVKAQQRLLLGISGGADSVCLLFVLLALKNRLHCEMVVVHVNHQIRKTAKRDEEFVAKLCERLNIRFEAVQADVPSYAKEQGLGLEEAARVLRYQAFEAVAKQCRADKIVVAHHGDDQAETLLFRLCRGTGILGMGGMKICRNNIIRPLLCLSREEIENYLNELGEEYMTDETNFDNSYARNAIRNEVFPLLSEKVCEKSGAHMAKSAYLLSLAGDYLDIQAQKGFESSVKTEADKNRIVLEIESFEKLHPYIQMEIIRKCIFEAAKRKKDIGSIHVEQVMRLLDNTTSKRVNLPYRVIAYRSYDEIWFWKEKSLPQADTTDGEDLLDGKGIRDTNRDGYKSLSGEKCEVNLEKLTREEMKVNLKGSLFEIYFSVFPYEKGMIIPTNSCMKWIDYDKIDKSLEIRYPYKEDYLYFDKEHKKSLKEYMKNEKIPLEKRDSTVVIADGNHILFIPEYRISALVKIDENTKRVLQIRISEIKNVKE